MQTYHDFANPHADDSDRVFYQQKKFIDKMRYDKLSADEKVAHQKIVGAWQQLGFKTHKKAERGTYMYLPTNLP